MTEPEPDVGGEPTDEEKAELDADYAEDPLGEEAKPEDGEPMAEPDAPGEYDSTGAEDDDGQV